MSDEQIKGKAEQGQGRVEQAAGDLTGDNKTKGKGMLHETEGKLREGTDKLREKIHHSTESK
jgi:uncharacterized protein YjbJ (UPF0337 family)